MDILEILFHTHGDLRKLILQYCYLGKDGTGLLANYRGLVPGSGGPVTGGLPSTYILCLLSHPMPEETLN